jgi:hypothetical protein
MEAVCSSDMLVNSTRLYNIACQKRMLFIIAAGKTTGSTHTSLGLLQKCWIEDCGELGHDDDWGLGDRDGTADVYPLYPADWDPIEQQLEVKCA